MSPLFLAANSGATYVCYITDGKMRVKHRCVLSLLRNMGRDVPTASTLCIMQLGVRIPYGLSQELSLLMIKAADAFCKNDHKAALFRQMPSTSTTY